MKFKTFTLLLAIFVSTTSCSREEPSNSVVLDTKKIECPQPAKLEYSPWGKSGLMAVCNVKHGPFVAVENGKVVVQGQYVNGKESGEWRWYDASGQVERTELKP